MKMGDLLRAFMGRPREDTVDRTAIRRQFVDELLARQHDVARRVHVLEWQTSPPPEEPSDDPCKS